MIPMMSPSFLALVVLAVILLGILEGRARHIAFITINLGFLFSILLGALGTVVTCGFLLTGYLLLLAVRRDYRWAFAAGLPTLTLLFMYMQDYRLLHMVVPSSALTSVLATIGLSFLFFKIVHVLIEARSGTLGEIDALSYIGYCTNFTTFAMGPLQRFQDYREQWARRDSDLPLQHYLDAIIRVLVGLTKAYVLAEWVRPFALPVTDAAEFSLGALLTGIYAFNVYLYLNFAGYTDVMIGAGTLFGIRPPENFNKPFLARDISDFWQRQHRSLTLWLTDYVYTPTFKRLLAVPHLRKRALLAISTALMITMLVSGLWHGTSFGFLLFGLMHGGYLVVNRAWDALLIRRFGKARIRKMRGQMWAHALAVLITFNAVSFAFVPFQLGASESLQVFGRFLNPLLQVVNG